MAQAFLNKVAKFLCENYGNDFHEICVVLPGRRAHLFLGEALKKQINGDSFMPKAFSIEEFVYEITGLVRVDAMHQLVQLYKVIIKIDENPPSFDEFMGWGEVLLNDFNDVDLHLADSSALFQYLSAAKAISLWNPSSDALSPFQTNYLKMYEVFGDYYTAFSDKLLESGAVYQGLAYRTLAENPVSFYENLPWKKVIMAGFNAMNPAEELIRQKLEKADKLVMLYDADSYYMDDHSQEAGKFLRNYYRSEGPENFRWIDNSLAESERSIDVYALPRKLAMARLLGELIQSGLSKLQTEDEKKEWLSRTVVVVPDELLLFPVLNSLPPEVGKFNVTMGLSLAHTPIASLLSGVFDLNEPPVGDTSGKMISARAFVGMMRHPYLSLFIRTLLPDIEKDISLQLKKILESGRVYWPVDALLNRVFNGLGGEVELLIRNSFIGSESSLIEWLEGIDRVFGELHQCLIQLESDWNIEAEYFRVFRKAINEMLGAATDLEFVSWFQIKRLLKQLIRSTQVAFYGEPLGGLQVMGMLETRTLDFERVFLLSANDDILPAASHSSSMIPFDIRIEDDFALPTFREKNAVFAYHFFHLLQRATEVHIFYVNSAGSSGGGEASRFLQQLKTEFVPKNPKTQLKMHKVVNHPENRTVEPFLVEKGPDVMELLHKKAKKGLSPTALNSYVVCRLQFFLQYVIGIREDEDTEGMADYRILGQAVHKAVENLYSNSLGEFLTTEVLDKNKEQCRELMNLAFGEVYPEIATDTGMNLLFLEAATLMLKSYFDYMSTQVQEGHNIRVLASELEMKRAIQIEIEGEPILVNLHGKADSIEEFDGHNRIVDFKTGKVELYDVGIDALAGLITEKSKPKAFQLLMYLWLSNHSYGDNISSGIISMKKISLGYIPLKIQGNDRISGSQLLDFEELLKELLEEIFDPNQSFTLTEDIKPCEVCSFKNICGR